MLISYKFYVRKRSTAMGEMRSFQSGLSTTYLELDAWVLHQAHFRTDSKVFHFQNAPEETDQATIFHFLGDLKKLKDSLCL